MAEPSPTAALRGARRLCGSILMTGMLCACATFHTTRSAAPATPVPVPSVEAETPPPQSTPPELSSDAPSIEADAPMPACLPTGNAKPRPKPKPKPVRKEAPPQPTTAPVVAEVRPGAIVDAQVRAIDMPVMSILGKKVQGPKGDDLGRVVDVLADATGRVRVAIIDFGGFLGVGNRRIAVDWPLLRFSPDEKDPGLLLSVSPEKLQSAPEYKDNRRPQILVPPAPSQAAPASPAPSASATSSPATLPPVAGAGSRAGAVVGKQ